MWFAASVDISQVISQALTFRKALADELAAATSGRQPTNKTESPATAMDEDSDGHAKSVRDGITRSSSMQLAPDRASQVGQRRPDRQRANTEPVPDATTCSPAHQPSTVTAERGDTDDGAVVTAASDEPEPEETNPIRSFAELRALSKTRPVLQSRGPVAPVPRAAHSSAATRRASGFSGRSQRRLPTSSSWRAYTRK